jgi:ABC-type phosphate transport system permease subunit
MGSAARRYEVIRSVVIPYVRRGMIGVIMLGLGRALGETMAVTFIIGNSHGLAALAVRQRIDDRIHHRQRIRRGHERHAQPALIALGFCCS